VIFERYLGDNSSFMKVFYEGLFYEGLFYEDLFWKDLFQEEAGISSLVSVF